eukprot:2376921-Pyramimonas_sp.AAC.1
MGALNTPETLPMPLLSYHVFTICKLCTSLESVAVLSTSTLLPTQRPPCPGDNRTHGSRLVGPVRQVASTIDNFRSSHMSELNELATNTRSSIGYGFPNGASKAKKVQTDDTQAITEASIITEASPA